VEWDRAAPAHTNEMTLRIGCNAVLIMQVLKTIPKEIGFAHNGHELTVEDTRIALSRDA
jgi:hypothetical protein